MTNTSATNTGNQLIEPPSWGVECSDALEFLRRAPDGFAHLVVIDPPYFKVKPEWWDSQWDGVPSYLEWLGGVISEIQRVMADNGSLYCFCSPALCWHVQGVVAESLNVLNVCRWVKEFGHHKRNSREQIRRYLTAWEGIVFAEQYNQDSMAAGVAGYASKCDKLRGDVFAPLRDYLRGEIDRAGWTIKDVIARGKECDVPGATTMSHYTSKSQWQLPTEGKYEWLRSVLNENGGEFLRRDYVDLRRDYEDLRRDYEDLRRDYEDLRTEYQELRRPFNCEPTETATDIFDFRPVMAYPGKHPCEKPQELLKHIINHSSREGNVVMDVFCGSGSTGLAAINNGRRFVGCDVDPHWAEYSRARLTGATAEA